MNIFMRFVDGKAKALTLSYDDGVVQDMRFVKIIDKYGLKATFNVNSGLFVQEDNNTGRGRMSVNQAKQLYTNSPHEVAVHSVTHPYLDRLPLATAVDEVLQDRKNLEQMFGRVIRGMAYPYGTFSDKLVEALGNVGIVYSREVKPTYDFNIPEDWLRLKPTCHHCDGRLAEVTDKFLELDPTTEKNNRSPKLFYLWGHTYEFDDHDNWNVIEDFAKKMGGKEDTWYATNIEIFDYITAYRNLEFSVDCTVVHNPSAQTVWFEVDRKTICVAGGETKRI